MNRSHTKLRKRREMSQRFTTRKLVPHRVHILALESLKMSWWGGATETWFCSVSSACTLQLISKNQAKLSCKEPLDEPNMIIIFTRVISASHMTWHLSIPLYLFIALPGTFFCLSSFPSSSCNAIHPSIHPS